MMAQAGSRCGSWIVSTPETALRSAGDLVDVGCCWRTSSRRATTAWCASRSTPTAGSSARTITDPCALRGAGVGHAGAGLCERGRRVPRRGPGGRGARARRGGRGDRRARRPPRHGRSADPKADPATGQGPALDRCPSSVPDLGRRGAISAGAARPDGRSGQRAASLARSQPKWAETSRNSEPQAGPPPPRNPWKQAKLRAGERLDRTQEVAGSSPASSTRRTPATAGVLSFERSVRLLWITAFRRFWPGFWPDLSRIRPYSAGLPACARPFHRRPLRQLWGRF
jgi:hypothetical protein